MTKKRTLLAIFGAVCVCVLSCAFVLTGCGNKHKFSSDEWTYDEDYHWHQCTKHDDDADDVEDKAKHDFVDVEVTKAATCTEAGEKTVKCSVCGYETTQTVEALGHTWNTGTVTTKATCTEKGETTYTCKDCGATKTEEIAALGHTYTLESTVTWKWDGDETTGYTAVASVECDVCHVAEDVTASVSLNSEGTAYVATATIGGATFTDSKDVVTAVDPVDHDAQYAAEPAWTYVKNEDNSYTVTATFECTVSGCENTEHTLTGTATVAATNVTTKAASCGVEGSISFTAKVTINGTEYTYNYYEKTAEALEHAYSVTFGEWTAVVDNSGVITGYTKTATVSCTNGCGTTFAEDTDYTLDISDDGGVWTATVIIGTAQYVDTDVFYERVFVPTDADVEAGETELVSGVPFANGADVKIVGTVTTEDGVTTTTYVVTGTASEMTTTQAAIFSIDGEGNAVSQEGDAYVVVKILVRAGETIYSNEKEIWTNTTGYNGYYFCIMALNGVNEEGNAIKPGTRTYTIKIKGDGTTSDTIVGTYVVDFTQVVIPAGERVGVPTETEVENGETKLGGVSFCNQHDVTIVETVDETTGETVYEVHGIASEMTSDQAGVFSWSGNTQVSQEGDAYVVIKILVKAGETISSNEKGTIWTNETGKNDYYFCVMALSGTNENNETIVPGTRTYTITAASGVVVGTYKVDFKTVTLPEEDRVFVPTSQDIESEETKLGGVAFQNDNTITIVEELDENDNIVYVVTGTASQMTAEQAKVFSKDSDGTQVSKEGDAYVVIKILLKPGESIYSAENGYIGTNTKTDGDDYYFCIMALSGVKNKTHTLITAGTRTYYITEGTGNDEKLVGTYFVDFTQVVIPADERVSVPTEEDIENNETKLNGEVFSNQNEVEIVETVDETTGETTYVVTGKASRMTEDQAAAFSCDEAGDQVSQEGDAYVVIKILLHPGESIYSEDKGYIGTNTGSTDDYYFCIMALSGINENHEAIKAGTRTYTIVDEWENTVGTYIVDFTKVDISVTTRTTFDFTKEAYFVDPTQGGATFSNPTEDFDVTYTEYADGNITITFTGTASTMTEAQAKDFTSLEDATGTAYVVVAMQINEDETISYGDVEITKDSDTVREIDGQTWFVLVIQLVNYTDFEIKVTYADNTTVTYTLVTNGLRPESSSSEENEETSNVIVEIDFTDTTKFSQDTQGSLIGSGYDTDTTTIDPSTGSEVKEEHPNSESTDPVDLTYSDGTSTGFTLTKSSSHGKYNGIGSHNDGEGNAHQSLDMQGSAKTTQNSLGYYLEVGTYTVVVSYFSGTSNTGRYAIVLDSTGTEISEDISTDGAGEGEKTTSDGTIVTRTMTITIEKAQTIYIGSHSSGLYITFVGIYKATETSGEVVEDV